MTASSNSEFTPTSAQPTELASGKSNRLPANGWAITATTNVTSASVETSLANLAEPDRPATTFQASYRLVPITPAAGPMVDLLEELSESGPPTTDEVRQRIADFSWPS